MSGGIGLTADELCVSTTVHPGAYAAVMSRLRASDEPSVRTLSRRLLTMVDDLARELADRIRRAEGHYRRADGVPADDLWESCRNNLRHILTQLAGDAPLDVEAARATGQRRAEQGVPLPAILHAYRIGGRYVWDTLVAHAEDNDAAREALFRTAGDVWTIIDDYSEALIEAYRETIADQAGHNLQVRNAVLTSLLDGSLGDGSRVWECAAMLNLPHQGTFVVVVAETLRAGDEALPGVEIALRRHDVASAWRLETARQVGVVAVRAPTAVTKICEQIAPLARGRVGVSETYTHLDQSAAALRQAQVACAAATPGTPELLRYEQHPTAVLLASVPELARNIANAILGPVLALPAADRKGLLDTMRAWFAEHGSASATAARMHMHRNTVHYRLRRVETLTGRDFTKPTDVGELHLALESIRILGLARRDNTVTPPHERQASKSRTDAMRTSAVG